MILLLNISTLPQFVHVKNLNLLSKKLPSRKIAFENVAIFIVLNLNKFSRQIEHFNSGIEKLVLLLEYLIFL